MQQGKWRRAESQLTQQQRRTIAYLIDNGYGIEAVMERFGLSEMAAMEYVMSGAPKQEPRWQVRWDDSRGDRHIRSFKTFKAAQHFSAALRNVEWKRVEQV